MTCDGCGHKEEIIKSIKSDFPDKCPKFGSKKYRQDFEARFGNANVIIDYCSVPNHLGLQGERNRKKLNSDELAKIDGKDKPKKKKPLWERMKNWK